MEPIDDPLERLALMLAPLVAEAMGGPSPFLDAAQVARRYGVDRGWVYEHAAELGAIRLGGGPRPRLRFDPRVVDEAMRGEMRAGAPRKRTRRPRKRTKSGVGSVALLPIGPTGGVASKRARRDD
jgi:hypothetical protein